MHRLKKIIILYVMITLFCGCVAPEKSNIELYDYKNIVIDKEYIELSQSDIETIIFMDFSSNDYFERIEKNCISEEDTILLNIKCSDILYCCEGYYYEVGSNELSEEFDKELLGKKAEDSFDISLLLEDKTVELEVEIQGIYTLKDINDPKAVIEFYGYDTLEETVSFLKKRASDEIVFNYMWDMIKDSSKIIEFPEYVIDEADNIIMQLSEEASLSGKSLDLYMAEKGIKLEDAKKEVYNYYYELIIAEEILKRENITISDSLKNECAKFLAEKNGLSIDELKSYMSEEEIYYQTVIKKIREILLSYVIIK